MEGYLSLVLWGALFFGLIFGVLAWWPALLGRRFPQRKYRGFPDSDEAWGFPYTRRYFQRRKKRHPKSRSDKRLQADMEGRIQLSGKLQASTIEVRVEKSVIFLSGTVSSAEEKELAQELAWKLPGARAVRNRLVVRKIKAA